MPVSTQTGPDGAVWIMDWYDKYPCYQNANADPAGVDREHGRIWRVVDRRHSRKAPSRRAPLRTWIFPSSALRSWWPNSDPNVWQRRTAQRLQRSRRRRSEPASSRPDAAPTIWMTKGRPRRADSPPFGRCTRPDCWMRNGSTPRRRPRTRDAQGGVAYRGTRISHQGGVRPVSPNWPPILT